ncbi:hypothetical protein A2U01_0101604, partial [Trifolium medium]|nr:hypothetical protein [Trifolium medium]
TEVRLPRLVTSSENWRDMAEYFQVPGESQRAFSLLLASTRSATTQEQVRSLGLARRLAQRPYKNMWVFVAV